MPALAVAQEPGGDLPQVISGQDPVGPGPDGGSVPAAGGLRGPDRCGAGWLAGDQRGSDGGTGGQRRVQRLRRTRGGLRDLQRGQDGGADDGGGDRLERGDDWQARRGVPGQGGCRFDEHRGGGHGPQHPGREGQPGDDGAVAERAGQERLHLRPGGQVAGYRPAGEADQGVRRPGQHGGDDGESGGGAGQAPQPGGRAGHGSTPLMPSSGVAVAVAWTVIACSPAASRICIGWTMVTVTVTAFPVTLAVPVVAVAAR